MDWVGLVQSGIEFIESRLEDSALSSELVSQHVHMSHSHFSRAFLVLTGLSVSEYIRNRRLSEAGVLLQSGEQSVLDVALQFGYESGEAFSKAFKRYHGVNPSACQGVELKVFWPLTVSVSRMQDKPLSYEVVEKEAFWLCGRGDLVVADDTTATSRLWLEYDELGYLDDYYEMQNFKYLVGGYEKELYGIQAMCSTPADVSGRKIAAHKWAVFKCEGQLPDSIDEMWEKIYSHDSREVHFELSGLPQLEVYLDVENGYKCEIWIPIKD